jgi:hypothetical protein
MGAVCLVKFFNDFVHVASLRMGGSFSTAAQCQLEFSMLGDEPDRWLSRTTMRLFGEIALFVARV